MIRRPPRSTLFPYTTLFRSAYGKVAAKKFGKVARGGNNNTIIPADYDRLSGSSAFYALTRVKIVKL